jgi:predicted HAD superfamily Cof-like phosphohydrolase
MSEIDDVRAFHERFGLPVSDGPRHLVRGHLAKRADFIFEELVEFVRAAGLRMTITYSAAAEADRQTTFGFRRDPTKHDQHLSAMADALVDLVYVALGTAVQLGLPWRALWDDVHAANMRKAEGEATDHKLGIVKPPGWVGPRTLGILRSAGYDRLRWIDDATMNVTDDRCVDPGKEPKP